MTTNYVQAEDQTLTVLNVAWNAGSAAIAGYIPKIYWAGEEEPEKPPSEKFWCRASFDEVFAQQTAAAVCDLIGTRRYTAYGLVIMQLFCPKSIAQSSLKGRKLAELARNSFRGVATAGKVVFRNGRINKLSPENLFYRFNIITEFEYDEVR